jgi:homospermidine synthase
MADKKHFKFPGRVVFVGFGSVAQGTLPLLLRHIDMPRERISIVTGDERGRAEAAHYGISYRVLPLTRENYRAGLDPLLAEGDFLLNLSVDVASATLVDLCCEKGAMYLDTCIEPWLGGYTDPTVSASHRSNYGLREDVLALRDKYPNGGPTVIPTHGANPGLISHWVKQGLINIARRYSRKMLFQRTAKGGRSSRESGRQDDPLFGARHAGGESAQAAMEFVNTWSVDGSSAKARNQRTRSAATARPDGRRHGLIAMPRLSYAARCICAGALDAERGPLPWLSHHQRVDLISTISRCEKMKMGSSADLSLCLSPCDDTVLSIHELAGRNWRGRRNGVMTEEIVDGIDEMGALMGHAKGALRWIAAHPRRTQARTATMRRASRSPPACWAPSGGQWKTRAPHYRSDDGIFSACSRSPIPTWAMSSASIPTGRRCTGATRSLRTWMPRIRGSSRISAWCKDAACRDC